MAEWLPSEEPQWWTTLKAFGQGLTEFSDVIEEEGPVGFVRTVMVRFIIGAVVGLTLNITALFRDVVNRVTSALVHAGEGVQNGVESAFLVVDAVMAVNEAAASLLAQELGLFAAPALVFLLAAELYIVLLLLAPLLRGLADLADVVPILGPVVAAGLNVILDVVEEVIGRVRGVAR